MVTGRLIVSAPGGSAWNMAVDEALMMSVASSRVPVCRVYSWSKPTLSLGYFQAARDRELHLPSRSCEWVRRSTGGGAILHHFDLTYSIVLPDSKRARGSAEDVYLKVHSAAINALGAFGVHAQRYRDLTLSREAAPVQQATSSDPFLCFQRRTEDDLVVVEGNGSNSKVLGSAQRRRGGALLQHGSFLLGRSEFAPELRGLVDLVPESQVGLCDSEKLGIELAKRAGQRLEIDWSGGDLSSEELAAAEGLVAEKYQSEEWNSKR